VFAILKAQTEKEDIMRKVASKTQTKKETRPKTAKRVIKGELLFKVGENVFEMELSGKVSATGKTIVFRSSKDDYLEQGMGCNIWVDLDLI
jgi:hypothetical protein